MDDEIVGVIARAFRWFGSEYHFVEAENALVALRDAGYNVRPKTDNITDEIQRRLVEGPLVLGGYEIVPADVAKLGRAVQQIPDEHRFTYARDWIHAQAGVER
jgi:hypothetical protein